IVAGVGHSRCPAHGGDLPFADRLFYREMDIRKGAAQFPVHLSECIEAAEYVLGAAGAMHDDIGRREFFPQILAPLVPHPLKPAAQQRRATLSHCSPPDATAATPR